MKVFARSLLFGGMAYGLALFAFGSQNWGWCLIGHLAIGFILSIMLGNRINDQVERECITLEVDPPGIWAQAEMCTTTVARCSIAGPMVAFFMLCYSVTNGRTLIVADREDIVDDFEDID
jgi:hypothetical protein